MQLNRKKKQLKQNNNPIEKMCRELIGASKEDILMTQQVPGKMFTITRHQESANKNHEISCHSHHQKERVLARMPRKELTVFH